MLWRGPGQAVIPTCEELGIGFVPWSPLGVQFLTGWTDASTRFAAGATSFRLCGRFSGENRDSTPRMSPREWPLRVAPRV